MHFVLLVVVVSGFIVRAGAGRRSSSLIGFGVRCSFFHFFRFFVRFFFSFLFVILFFPFFLLPWPSWPSSLKHRLFPLKSLFQGTVLGERTRKEQIKSRRPKHVSFTIARTGQLCYSRAWKPLTPTTMRICSTSMAQRFTSIKEAW